MKNGLVRARRPYHRKYVIFTRVQLLFWCLDVYGTSVGEWSWLIAYYCYDNGVIYFC